jgi:hypothetical protein
MWGTCQMGLYGVKQFDVRSTSPVARTLMLTRCGEFWMVRLGNRALMNLETFLLFCAGYLLQLDSWCYLD